MIYPIAETFTSLKGEGEHTGRAMFFIRFSGCNLNCDFCDTDWSLRTKLDEYDLLRLADESGVKHIVLTGGEPGMRKLEPLITLLVDNRYEIHIESNGSYPLPRVHWLTVSPKNVDLDPGTMMRANEVKFLCGLPKWKTIIEKVIDRYRIVGRKYLMPIALGKYDRGWSRTQKDVRGDNVKEAIEYCLLHPEFSYCAQLHKYLNIP